MSERNEEWPISCELSVIDMPGNHLLADDDKAYLYGLSPKLDRVNPEALEIVLKTLAEHLSVCLEAGIKSTSLSEVRINLDGLSDEVAAQASTIINRGIVIRKIETESSQPRASYGTDTSWESYGTGTNFSTAKSFA